MLEYISDNTSSYETANPLKNGDAKLEGLMFFIKEKPTHAAKDTTFLLLKIMPASYRTRTRTLLRFCVKQKGRPYV